MSALEIFKAVEEGGLKSAGIVIILVVAYKIYRMKITTESNCCDRFKFSTSNGGGGEETYFSSSDPISFRTKLPAAAVPNGTAKGCNPGMAAAPIAAAPSPLLAMFDTFSMLLPIFGRLLLI